mmetsp:Transcript_16316/g.28903  ORF Transcript_16316/g.28903 Transcript_16316/m.28903 type:complete len:123 (-) Transcript_16316:1193-1561(-)
MVSKHSRLLGRTEKRSGLPARRHYFTVYRRCSESKYCCERRHVVFAKNTPHASTGGLAIKEEEWLQVDAVRCLQSPLQHGSTELNNTLVGRFGATTLLLRHFAEPPDDLQRKQHQNTSHGML